MKKIACFLIISGLLSVTSGCMLTRVDLSDEGIKGKGILVARFTASNLDNGYSKFYHANVKINGDTYIDAIKNDALIVPLAPGSYELDSIETEYVNARTIYPTKQKFEIRENQVTSLGLVTFLYKKKGAKYLVVNIDNHKDMQGYLNAVHPDIFAGFDKQHFLGPEKGYLRQGVVDKLKARFIVERVGTSTNRNFGSGIAGTIARFPTLKSGKKKIELLDVGTYNNFSTCFERGQRYTCLGRNSEYKPTLFMFEGKKMWQRPAPNNNMNASLYMDGKSAMIITDEYFVIHVSEDNGKTWLTNDKYKSDTPAWKRTRYLDGHSYTQGVNGIYIRDANADDSNKNRVVLWSYGNKFRTYTLPDENRLFKPVDTTSILYAGPYSPVKGPYDPDIKSSLVYSLKKDGKEWKEDEIPANECKSMMLIDAKKGLMATACERGVYVGKAGMKWRAANTVEALKYRSLRNNSDYYIN